MTCGGCSGAVNRALGKMEGEQMRLIRAYLYQPIIPMSGLKSYDVNLEKQIVTVIPETATYEQVLEKIKKTGKEVGLGRVHNVMPSVSSNY